MMTDGSEAGNPHIALSQLMGRFSGTNSPPRPRPQNDPPAARTCTIQLIEQIYVPKNRSPDGFRRTVLAAWLIRPVPQGFEPSNPMFRSSRVPRAISACLTQKQQEKREKEGQSDVARAECAGTCLHIYAHAHPRQRSHSGPHHGRKALLREEGKDTESRRGEAPALPQPRMLRSSRLVGARLHPA